TQPAMPCPTSREIFFTSVSTVDSSLHIAISNSSLFVSLLYRRIEQASAAIWLFVFSITRLIKSFKSSVDEIISEISNITLSPLTLFSKFLRYSSEMLIFRSLSIAYCIPDSCGNLQEALYIVNRWKLKRLLDMLREYIQDCSV